MNICRIPTHSPYFYLLLVFLSWVVSFLLTIPAYNIFHVFSYFPEQYHCMISFTNISGFTYSLFVCYVIPMGLILYMYSKVIKYVRKLPKRGLTLHTKREVMIIRSILKICFIITIPGLSTVFFLLQSIFRGSTHPLADRIHELCVAIGAFVLGFGFAILNSLLYVLPRQSISHETNPMIHLQEFN
ncbi:hypothetical protein I4U23_015332 [Adineta vaga]|nr:hypothetical protein I4U23_015332 [Adineta vaga]